MNSYTHPLTNEQAAKLRALLKELGFEFSPKEYTLFFARKNKLSVAVYEKGPKVLVQGKGVGEFVQFELEPKILGEAKLGYEEVHLPEMFEPHFGVYVLRHNKARANQCNNSRHKSSARYARRARRGDFQIAAQISSERQHQHRCKDNSASRQSIQNKLRR